MMKNLLKTLVAVLAIAAAATGPVRAQSITCSADDLGKVICTDGSIYATVSAATTAGKTAAAMIAYVDETNLNGLALALAEDGNMNWSTANGASGAAAHTPTVTGQAWKLPSVAEFKQMLKAFGGNEDSYTGLNTAVTNAGGTPFETDDAYWTSTEHSSASGRGTEMEFFGESNYVDWDWSIYTSIHRVRACFSFSVVLTPKYTVRFAAGTEDAANWTVTPAEALTTGVIAGSTLTATYAGDLKVKEVIATKHLEPNEVPLTIEALTAGTVVVHNPQSGMQYTLNGGTKTAVTSAAINVAAGDKVAFYGNGTSITSYFGTTIAGTADVKAYGNIMSLVDENGFATATTLTANDAFNYLFGDYAHLKDISGLLLPATTLTESCYATMFYNCTGLTTVPSDLLPATTLTRNCYASMFYNCTGLTTVPSNLLPATTLAMGCYAGMFNGCVNLTNVPTLPATTLAQLCYNNMFLACHGLTTVPTDLLPATTLAPSCYSYMFLNCFNLTTAPALPATTLAEKCYQSMFANCTTLAASPVLPATTLAEKCYQQMFYDCENLATVPDTLPATTLASYCYQQMFYGCENLAAAPVLPATTLVSYCYQQMFYDCSNLSSVTCLATSGINQNNSTEDWLSGAGSAVQGTKTVNAASSATWPMNNVSGIPSGWTLVTPPTPLTLEALTAGTIVVGDPQSGMQYTLNGGTKTPMTESPTEITVAVGDKVAFYGNGTNITRYDGTVIGGGTAEVKAYGNIMSLVNETGFDTATTLTAFGAFYYLFQDYFNLKDISGLKLPATTLTQSCYESMFSNCTGLTTVPTDLLPATTLARRCYRRMFAGCDNLTNVPTLPATTLARECYDMMFFGCAGLTTVPTHLLPATTLAESCYSSMFYYCSNLTTAPVLPATTLVDACYSRMFSSCYNLSSVTCLATSGINQNSSTDDWLSGAGDVVQGTKTFNAVSTAEWPTSVSGIPSGWTRQNIDN